MYIDNFPIQEVVLKVEPVGPVYPSGTATDGHPYQPERKGIERVVEHKNIVDIVDISDIASTPGICPFPIDYRPVSREIRAYMDQILPF